MRKILVTGGAGYIGSHACKALKIAGNIPVTFDNLSTGWADAVKYGPLEVGDLTDRTALDRVFSEHKPDAVMHFGALSDVGQSTREPGLYWKNNAIGSLNLIEAMIAAGCRNMVFSSTCATYGEQDNVLLTEDAAQKPINAYGGSKLAIEQMLADFGASDGLNSVIFRYFNVAGADPDGEIGEYHRPETHLIPLALMAALGQRDKLTVFGSDYDTPDGTCIRDYVHVSDLIDAHLAGLNWLDGGNPSRAFNLGTGKGFSVREVIDVAQNVTGLNVPHGLGERRAGDCTSLVSASNRAKSELGWMSHRSTLETMISDAWRWHQTNGYGS